MTLGQSARPPADLRAAFEELARLEAPSLYRTARRLARPPTEAADLVQETLLRAYRTFANFRPGTNGRAWLFTILYTVAVNETKKHERRREVAVEDIETGVPPLNVAITDEELQLLRHIDVSPQIESALAQLAEPFRTAVILVDIEELTYEEAASVVGCPVGTLRSRLFRGRRQLFVSLAEYARQVGLLEKH